MISDLTQKHMWPSIMPETKPINQGWFSGKQFFIDNLKKDTKIIVELGSWLGKSTKFFLNNYPESNVIAIDHWKGSEEHQTRFKKLLPVLFDTFLVNCWNFKERLIPIRMSTTDGLKEVYNFGISPNFIYVDAGHSFDEVVKDISTSIELFPHAIIGGDDWIWRKSTLPVQKAVKHCAKKFNKKIKFSKNNWLYY